MVFPIFVDRFTSFGRYVWSHGLLDWFRSANSTAQLDHPVRILGTSTDGITPGNRTDTLISAAMIHIQNNNQG